MITLQGWLEQNPVLAWTAAFQVALAIFALIAMPFDHRTILGINPWIKPLKFDVSVGIMLVTLAAILSGLQGFDRSRPWIGAGVGVALSLENCIISLQSLRGVRSHMNYSTPLDAHLFACMAVSILISTLFFAWTLGLVVLDPTRWPPAVAWGVRLGLLTLLAGCVEGFLMVRHGGHTVGANDGLSGLPIVNWSRDHGDLRIAHFFALHALQAFPLLGWLLSRTSMPVKPQLALTCIGAALYLGAVWLLFHQAMAGRPLLRGESLVAAVPGTSLSLPSDIPSETVQIHYFMGGYGGFVRAEKGKSTYEIVASLDGKPAAVNIKVIAYLPGCEIVTLEIPMQGTTVSRRPLSCKPLGRVLLRGQISPMSIIPEHQPTEIEVDYLAMWDHEFFGIMDGPVTSLHVATTVADEKGEFEVAIPDFSKQTKLGEAEFEFILRQTTTGNIIAFLQPTGEDSDSLGLKVLPSYPAVTQFLASRP